MLKKSFIKKGYKLLTRNFDYVLSVKKEDSRILRGFYGNKKEITPINKKTKNIRSQNLKNSFEVYGADFGMQNGRRIPGAFNYYYLFLLTSISKNILILNYISLILSLLTFAYLLVSHKKTISYVGLLFSIIFYLTSTTFITQLTKFWNPTLGLPFIIISLNFFLIFLSKPKFSYLFFAFIFGNAIILT